MMTSKTTQRRGVILPFLVKSPSARRCLCASVAVALTLGLAGVAGGCGKKTEEATPVPSAIAQSPTEPAPGPPVARKAPQPQTLAVPEGANSEAVLQQMNRELLRWIVGNRRTPKSFEEFVSSAQLTVPPPPAGKRYVLGKDMKIVLK